MSNITLSIVDGHAVTSSRQIAETFTKQHTHVLRKIENLGCSKNFTESNFGLSEYIDSTGRSCKEYTITRDGFTILAMGFTGSLAMEYKEAYITAFNRMERKLGNQPESVALPNPTPEGMISIPLDDWFEICNVVHAVSNVYGQALSDSIHNGYAPLPRHLPMPYSIAQSANHATGMIYTHTFNRLKGANS